MSARHTRSHEELRALVGQYAAARLAVRNATTRAKFALASADLWDIERQLDEEGASIGLEART